MYDLVIQKGTLLDPVDGLREGNIGIEGGKIAEISEKELQGKSIIDAFGMVVSPGFIDIHMHEDPIVNGKISFDIANFMALMGVTTAVGGNCGIGHWKVADYMDVLDQQGGPINQAGLIGISGIREAVGCEDKYSPANHHQITSMVEFVEKELERGGAAGISFGLEYIPGTSTEEMLALAQVAAKFPGRLAACHYRYDAVRSLEALAEMIIVARETRVRFEISHIGSCIAFGQMTTGLRMLEAAHDSGVDIMADVYPYNAFCTFIGSAIFDTGCFERWGTGYESILVASGTHAGQYCDENLFEQLRKDDSGALAVAFVMDDKEVNEAIRHPFVMIGSDGLLSEGGGHPRATGAFPRVLGRYVREKELLDLETAIRKMTLMPAQRLGLHTKGRIKEGYDGDLTIFDPDRILDTSDFMDVRSTPEGISYVIVNGIETVANGRLTGNLPGRSIRFR